MDVGQRIKRARERIGWSQARLGDFVGLSKSAISQWENGHTRPQHENMEKAVRALGLPAGELFGDKEPTGLVVKDRRELALLELFRGLSDEGREHTLRFLYAMIGESRQGRRGRKVKE